ncbi:MAG: UbiX family flavin prenyltransferase, partial [Saezia sp.]
QALREVDAWETHLVVSHGGELTISYETSLTVDQVKSMADVVYDNESIGAAIASGTFRTEGMVVIPCSMKTVGGIASGYSDNLLLRAADVCLKERRPLILVARETPLSPIHLKNMQALSMVGVCILPPSVAYYNKPQTIQDVTSHIVGKVLDQFDIDYSGLKRWNP